MAARLIYSTWPDEAQAKACAAALIDRRLAACVTILPAATSFFRWEGKIERQSECVMFAKTDASRAAALRDALGEAHPYDLPCILALDVNTSDSSAEFLQWVATETPT
jgi:periplasmic divalent cation tolerance protein